MGDEPKWVHDETRLDTPKGTVVRRGFFWAELRRHGTPQKHSLVQERGSADYLFDADWTKEAKNMLGRLLIIAAICLIPFSLAAQALPVRKCS